MPPEKKEKKIVILQKDSPILRKISSPIPVSKIKTADIKNLISDLVKTIGSQSDAVAISSVQIGKPLRLFVIAKKAFDITEPIVNAGVQLKEENNNKKDLIFINPKIIKVSKSKQKLEEGCLSVRYVYGKVIRSEKVTIEALDENGKKFSRGFSGFLAQVVQHENDHLDGILFIDKATDIEELTPEEYEKGLKNL